MPVNLAIAAIRRVTEKRPGLAMILGSGLGGIVEQIEDAVSLDFADIPGFVPATAEGHAGQLVFGRLAGQTVVAMAGRLHRYGGWSVPQVTFPVRVMAACGADHLVITNAAGGLNPHLSIGDFVLIEDHLDWMFGARTLRFSRRDPSNAATGRPLPLGTSLPSQATKALADLPGLMRSDALYDPGMIEEALAAARQAGFAAFRGTYLATLGPNYETRAEYRMMRRLGADVVGMSTVPEVQAAAELGMRILAVSMVSNLARPDLVVKANHEEVLQAGAQAVPKLASIVHAVAGTMS